jgi:putative SOS response-associated peptidase YedK
MCGRFVSASPPDQLASYFDAAPSESLLPPSYNVAPSNDVYAVIETPDGQRRLETFHWGLVPVWAKDIKTGLKMINARAETVATSNAYKRAFKQRRCIIPVDGFYEWQARPGEKRKQPFFIQRTDGEPLAFAGLWETWRDKNAGADAPLLHTCTIITTTANDTMTPVHNRMPVILPPSAWKEWLEPGNDDLVSLGELLVPAPNSLLTLRPVSTDVNNVRSKGAHLLDPFDPDAPPAAAGDTPDRPPPSDTR